MNNKDDIVERLKAFRVMRAHFNGNPVSHNAVLPDFEEAQIACKAIADAIVILDARAKRIAELEAEVERYRDKYRGKEHAKQMREWNYKRAFATNRWISADVARIHREAQKRGWKGGEPAEPYVPKELVEKIRRVYGYLKRRADRDFLRANPQPVLEPPNDPA